MSKLILLFLLLTTVLTITSGQYRDDYGNYYHLHNDRRGSAMSAYHPNRHVHHFGYGNRYGRYRNRPMENGVHYGHYVHRG
ncbi:hypothetical protein HDE_05717 [Halotydeus destructor]|nr:hypothetical protein HDE_05717 [Halotydeus destructor]